METCGRILVVCSGGRLRGLCLSGGFDQSLVGLLAMDAMASHDWVVGIGHLRVVVFISGPLAHDQVPVGSLDGNWICFLRLGMAIPIALFRRFAPPSVFLH